MSVALKTLDSMPSWSSKLAFSLVAIFIFASTSRGVEVIATTLDEVVSGELDQIMPTTVYIKQGEAVFDISNEQLLSLQFGLSEVENNSLKGVLVDSHLQKKQIEKTPTGEVRLVDGSNFYHSDWFISNQEDELTFSKVNIELSQCSASTEVIHSWRLPGKISSTEARLWKDLINSSPVSDLLVIRRRSNGELKPIDGVIEQIEDAGVVFRIAEETLTVGWDRIFGLIFFQLQQEKEQGSIVSLKDKSQLYSSLCFTNNRLLKLVTLSGAMIQAPLDRVAEIDYSAGKILWLEDLPIISSDWNRPTRVPKQIDFSPRFNRSFANQPLRLHQFDKRNPLIRQTVEFKNGVAMRSGSHLTLAIPQGVRWLKGRVGIDPLTWQTGSADLVVLLDGMIIQRLAIDGADAPQIIEIPLANDESERELTIQVEQGYHRDVGDSLHFVEARVTK